MHASLEGLFARIDDIEIAMMTTRRPDGHLQSRAMATQKRAGGADLWFVTLEGSDDGEAALRTIADERPALVFLDLGLPGVDGLEVARRVRARPEAGRPVLVALTGRGHQDDRDASAEAGFDHHMVKPVSSDLLRDLLARLNGPS